MASPLGRTLSPKAGTLDSDSLGFLLEECLKEVPVSVPCSQPEALPTIQSQPKDSSNEARSSINEGQVDSLLEECLAEVNNPSDPLPVETFPSTAPKLESPCDINSLKDALNDFDKFKEVLRDRGLFNQYARAILDANPWINQFVPTENISSLVQKFYQIGTEKPEAIYFIINNVLDPNSSTFPQILIIDFLQPYDKLTIWIKHYKRNPKFFKRFLVFERRQSLIDQGKPQFINEEKAFMVVQPEAFFQETLQAELCEVLIDKMVKKGICRWATEEEKKLTSSEIEENVNSYILEKNQNEKKELDILEIPKEEQQVYLKSLELDPVLTCAALRFHEIPEVYDSIKNYVNRSACDDQPLFAEIKKAVKPEKWKEISEAARSDLKQLSEKEAYKTKIPVERKPLFEEKRNERYHNEVSGWKSTTSTFTNVTTMFDLYDKGLLAGGVVVGISTLWLARNRQMLAVLHIVGTVALLLLRRECTALGQLVKNQRKHIDQLTVLNFQKTKDKGGFEERVKASFQEVAKSHLLVLHYLGKNPGLSFLSQQIAAYEGWDKLGDQEKEKLNVSDLDKLQERYEKFMKMGQQGLGFAATSLFAYALFAFWQKNYFLSAFGTAGGVRTLMQYSKMEARTLENNTDAARLEKALDLVPSLRREITESKAEGEKESH